MRKVIALFTLALLLAGHTNSASAATLDELHLSFQHDPRTTITVMWRTAGNLTPHVQYGTTSAYGSDTAGATTAAVADGFFYNTVELTGLTPDTAYHYRVSGDTSTWSGDNSFRTAPAGAGDFSFTASGDNGVRANSPDDTLKVKDLVASQHPTFHIVAGDITYSEGSKNQWEQWFQEVERFSHSVALVPALGNHDAESGVKFSNGEYFYQRSFALPADHQELYYSFDYGDAHFVALNSEDFSGLRRGGAQYQWLAADLAATAKKWKIIYFHRLAYTSGSEHHAESNLQNDVTPLFDQYHVDLVIQGHNHQYERSYPLRYGSANNPVIASTDRTSYTNPTGTVYVVTGGGGHSLYDFDTQPAWSATRCKCYEVLRVDISAAGTLSVKTIGVDGATVDQFTISKTSAAVVSPPPPAPQPPAPLPQPQTTASNLPTTSYVLPTQQSIRGFNLAVWWHDVLNQETTRASIGKMKETGANYFGLAPFWYQQTKTSTAIYRRPQKTATDDSIRSAIRYAESIGRKVALKPMVDSEDGSWRGQFTPANANAWFQSYHDFILTFAHIAKDEGVDYLVIGTEFTTLSTPQYAQKWRDIIRDIRAIYSGPLTYAANWGTHDSGEYSKITWWDALDSVGIDAYFPLSENNTPTVQSVAAAWKTNWFNDIKTLREQFNKPVLMTEIGYLSCDGAGKKPWQYPCNAGVDGQEQADLYEGTLSFWKDYDWMQGFLFWRWDPNPNAGGASDGDYMPQGKPAQDVLKQFWLAAPIPPPSSSPTRVEETIGNFPPDGGGVSGGGQSAGTAGSPAPDVGTVSGNHSVAPTPISPPAGGGGGTPTTIGASTPNTSTSNTTSLSPIFYVLRTQPPFAYGKPRMPTSGQERAKTWELSLALRKIFHTAPPIQKKYWYFYTNAYIYGGYPPEVIARAINLRGKVVHPSIPYTAWRRSADYKRYMR